MFSFVNDKAGNPSTLIVVVRQTHVSTLSSGHQYLRPASNSEVLSDPYSVNASCSVVLLSSSPLRAMFVLPILHTHSLLSFPLSI